MCVLFAGFFLNPLFIAQFSASALQIESEEIDSLIKSLYVKRVKVGLHLPSNSDELVFVDELQSPTSDVVDSVKERLLRMAKQSASLRTTVIQRLLTVLERSERDRSYSEIGASVWYCAFEVFGELRAEKAIDIMVRHLNFRDKVITLSLHYAVVYQVVKIGQPAVPRLVQALYDEKPSVRGLAAVALGEIRGKEAEEALKDALLTESDGLVINNIKVALSKLSRKE